MAGTLKVPKDKDVSPYDTLFDLATQGKLEALDYFRQGHIEDGFSSMGLDFPYGLSAADAFYDAKPWSTVKIVGTKIPNSINVVSYSPTRKAKFKKQMLSLADKLESCGY